MYANAWGSGLETAAPQNRSPGYARACQQKSPRFGGGKWVDESLPWERKALLVLCAGREVRIDGKKIGRCFHRPKGFIYAAGSYAVRA